MVFSNSFDQKVKLLVRGVLVALRLVVCKLGVLALWGAFAIIYGAINHKLWLAIIMAIISAPYQTINHGIYGTPKC